MKLRWKILLCVLAAIVWVFGIQSFVEKHLSSAPLSPGPNPDLRKIYNEFNQVYFKNALPHDVLLDWTEVKEIATTNRLSDGVFYIRFNTNYALAERIARQTMLHEQCHVLVFMFDKKQTAEDLRTKQHGKMWRTCMLQLDLEGALRREFIDFYEGN